MSYLEKSKRQAKRLLQLAKKDNKLTIPINNLAEAQNVVAVIDGYNNWHNYAENLKNKDLQSSPIIQKNYLESSVKYLSKNHIEDFEKYYVNSLNEKIHVFTNSSPLLSFNVKNLGMYVPIGQYIEKKGWRETRHVITLNPQHCTIWSSENKYFKRDIIEKFIMKDIGAIYIDTNEDNSIYSDLYKICKKYNNVNNLYCINFMSKNAKKSSHSFDPINFLIPFKEQFLSIFNLKTNYFSDLFYKLCKDCYDAQIAVDSTVIFNFLSLKSLIKNENEILKEIFNMSKNEINQYLKFIGVEKELNENWLTNNKECIQNHHLQVQNILFINNIIKKYEDIGIFSIYPQVDLQNIVSQNKVLTVLFPKLTKFNPDVKELTNIFMINLLTMEINIIDTIKKEVIPVTSGFFSMQIFDNLEHLLNENTLQLFNKFFLESNHSRKILSFVCIKDYKSLESNFKDPVYKYLLSIFISHFKQHMIMQQKNPLTEFCYEVKNQIISNCENFENIFHKENKYLIDLKNNQICFFKLDSSQKTNYMEKGFCYKIEYFLSNTCLKEMEVLWIEHSPIRE